MFLRAGSITMHVRIDGPEAAEPLVLLHSLGTSAAVWEAQAAALVGPFRVIRPDLRGHGLSGVTPGPYTIQGMAADVLAVLDALGVQQAHVAGLSIGGLIAQAMAHAAPGRVSSLVLVDTALAIPPAQGWTDRAVAVRAHGLAPLVDGVMARWVTPDFRAEPGARGLETMLLRTDPEGYAAAAEAIATADLTAATQALTMPALVLVGEHDVSTPPAMAQALADALRAPMIVLPGAAHIPTVQVPGRVTDAMRRFLLPDVTDFYEAGMAVRRRVLGAEHVERSLAHITDLDRDFQHFITRTAWGGVWTRPGLTLRERSLLVVTMLAALGHHEELRLHLRATRNTGVTAAEVAEALIQVAAYAGIPAANSAVRIAKEVLG